MVLPGGEPRPGIPAAGDRVLLLAPPPLRHGDLATARVDHAAPEARWEMLSAPEPPRELRLAGPAGTRTLLVAGEDAGGPPFAAASPTARAGVLALTLTLRGAAALAR